MADHPKAQVVPFSSVVGNSVTLHGPTGVVIGQLAILNVGGTTPEDWKQRSIAVATDVAMRINAHEALVTALDVLKAGVGGEIKRDSPEFWDQIDAAIDAADSALAKGKGLI